MLARDFTAFTLGAIGAHRTRSLLTVTGIGIGVAAVVLLTAIGEGIHRFVLAEFTQFGTNLIAVNPGKTSTLGMSGAVISNVRPLSLDDAEALGRLPDVEAVVPTVQGNAAMEGNGRSRRTTVLGVGPRMPEVLQMRPARAATGSSRAARMAGSSPNTSPVTMETLTAARGAQRGTTS
jgi:putative ABC transport system permease protein